jgi:hypothetical protein
MATNPTEGDIDARELVREAVSSLHYLRHLDLDTVGPALGLAIPPQHPEFVACWRGEVVVQTGAARPGVRRYRTE